MRICSNLDIKILRLKIKIIYFLQFSIVIKSNELKILIEKGLILLMGRMQLR